MNKSDRKSPKNKVYGDPLGDQIIRGNHLGDQIIRGRYGITVNPKQCRYCGHPPHPGMCPTIECNFCGENHFASKCLKKRE